MKVLIPIKRVIDYNVKVKIKPDNSDVDLSNLKMSINPFCEIAVEEAVRLKEQGIATELVAVTVGEKVSQEQLRTALALGVDRAIQVEAPPALDSLVVAKILKHIVTEEKPDLVILGKQSIDSDNNQTGQMLGALCSMPQGTFASKVAVTDRKVSVTREIDGGLQTLQLELPAIVTTDLRLNEPRYAKLPDIMKAKRKPLKVVPLADTGVDANSKLTVLRVEAPEHREAGIKVTDVNELVHKLKTEAKVL